MGRRHRVAIVGAGFGGLFAARALRRADLQQPGAIPVVRGVTGASR